MVLVLVLIAAVIFAWGALSGRLQAAGLTAPMVFVAVGVLLAAQVPDVDAMAGWIKALTEVTLVWVLFSDAARVGIRELRTDAGVYGRLLGVGLPLTVAAGCLAAWALFGDLGLWMALLIGAALAPTDAALGAVVISHPAVPVRVRRILNVESGLNDGIVTPVVLLALAGAAAHGDGSGGVLAAAAQLAGGALV
ncbi:MAG: cation:proton antiporter, partial [Actinoplanes sp.]